jgi:hypothetical protein
MTTELYMQRAMHSAIHDVDEMIEECIEDLQCAWEQDTRDSIGTQLTVLYALRDTMRDKVKQLNYIWN